MPPSFESVKGVFSTPCKGCQHQLEQRKRHRRNMRISERRYEAWVRGDVTHGRRHRGISTPCQIHLNLDTSIGHPKVWYQVRRLKNVLTGVLLEMACGIGPNAGIRMKPRRATEF
jgi:hypothetical protein